MIVRHFILSLFIVLPATVATDVYDLSPHFVEGQVWTVEDHLETTVFSDTIPGRKQSQVLSFRKKFRVDKVHSDGRVEQTLHLKMIEREGSGLFASLDWSKLDGIPIAMILESSGDILEIKEPEKLDQTSRTLFNFFKQIMITNQNTLFLPDKPVSIDDTWNKTEAIAFELPFFGQVDEVVDITGMLNAVKTTDGQEYFEIRFEGVHSGSVGNNAQGTIEGRMEGTMLWDVERGVCRKFEAEGQIKLVMASDDGDVQMEIQSKGTSTIIPDTAVR